MNNTSCESRSAAFGGDSFVELLSSLAVLQYLRLLLNGTGEPLEAHGKQAEWVTALPPASLIPVIGLGAIYSFLTGVRPEASLLGIGASVGAMTHNANSLVREKAHRLFSTLITMVGLVKACVGMHFASYTKERLIVTPERLIYFST